MGNISSSRCSERIAAIRDAAVRVASRSIRKTYFLLFSSSEAPPGRRFVRLRSPTVLAWFQQAWRNAQKEGDWAAGLGGLRGAVYGLDSLFYEIVDQELECPNTENELVQWLMDRVCCERHIEAGPHFIHVETDDARNTEYFFFDDDFLRAPGALARLPSPNRGEGGGSDEKAAHDDYAVFVTSRRLSAAARAGATQKRDRGPSSHS